jgi:hypothetical protein
VQGIDVAFLLLGNLLARLVQAFRHEIRVRGLNNPRSFEVS